jgi:hypothetical protein
VSLAPESIQSGQCYLTTNGQVARVLRLSAEERVSYEFRDGTVARAFGWTAGVTDLRSFTHLVERQVPCDWTPKTA